MITFLFWNLRGNPIQERLANLAWLHQVDVIMLAECAIPANTLLFTLNRGGASKYHYSPCNGCSKIVIFTSFLDEYIRPIYETDRLTVRHLQLPGLTTLLLAVTHCVSKTNWSGVSQGFEAVPLAADILRAEQAAGHTRTVLVGDLNMNPFEAGIVSAVGLHAVMSRSIAERGRRKVQAKEYPFFYNPMWNMFGDKDDRPPGTYFYSQAEQLVYFWHIFDQVLLRPESLPYFATRDLEVLTSDGHSTLLTGAGVPDASAASDHLPILFRLNL